MAMRGQPDRHRQRARRIRPGVQSPVDAHLSSTVTNKAPKITIREVAALAGVSLMTVTRVMRNEKYVGEKTRLAVQGAIQQLGYAPLQSARDLAASVPRSIGLVVPHATEQHISDRTGAEYMHGLQMGALLCCKEHGYALRLVVLTRSKPAASELIANVRMREVGGYLVAAPATEIPGLLKGLSDGNVPFAAVSPFKSRYAPLWVAADERTAVRELTEHLIALGHRRIGFAGGGADSRAGVERPAGYFDAMAGAGLPVDPAWLAATGFGFEAGQRAGTQLLTLAERPTAILCVSDDAAAGVVAAARQQGIDLPRDLSVVGFNNIGLSRKIWPTLSTADLPVEQMAAQAALLLINQLGAQDRSETAPVSVILSCALHHRDSVAAAPADTVRPPDSRGHPSLPYRPVDSST
jgi:LacI family transcriptional regulator